MKLVSKIFKRDDWYVTSKFGYREPISTKKGVTGSFHNGCDYGTNKQKWPQYAIENGIVIDCGIARDGAKYVWVNYPRINKKLLHYHLDSICVKKNQNVTEDTLLGYTGATGMVTGIHLHLGMKNSNGGDYQDPDAYDYQQNNIIPPSSNNSNIFIEYTVQKGDSLSKIALMYKTNWKKIYELNRGVIGDNPNLIKPGQVLKIQV